MAKGHKYTTEEFICRAKEIHGDKYDYSKTIYIGLDVPVDIICHQHGLFAQAPRGHLKGGNCPYCTKEKRRIDKTLSQEEFIRRAILTHGSKYNYSKVKYINQKTNVCIVCPIHGDVWVNPYNHVRGTECPKCTPNKFKKPVFGVGINDVDLCPPNIYWRWNKMLQRCYSPKRQSKNPTYIGCSVCDEWLYLSNYKKWFEDNYVEGFEIDKDILVKGNKVYSPDTCCFVPQEINGVFGNKPKGAYARGIGSFRCGKYIAAIHINGKRLHLGSFSTKEEAIAAYNNAKEKHVKELAEKYFKEGKITERVYNALMKYEVVD